MNEVTIYNLNDTMRLLGYQCPAEIITKEARKQMGEITAARKYTTTFCNCYGYVYAWLYLR